MLTAQAYPIRLSYFKESGKYYSSGSYMTHHEHMYQVIEEVKGMLKQGHRPGLVDGHSGFTVLVDGSDHPNGYPHLLYNQA